MTVSNPTTRDNEFTKNNDYILMKVFYTLKNIHTLISIYLFPTITPIYITQDRPIKRKRKPNPKQTLRP